MPKPRDDSIRTRPSLLNRIKNPEDRDSWQDFDDTYRRLIYCFAVKAGLTDAEAKDVVQETLLSVFKKMPGFRYDPSKRFKSWLWHTTQFRILDFLRERAREPGANRRHDRSKPRTATVERIQDPAGLDLERLWDQEWDKWIFEAALKRVKRQVKGKPYQIFDLYVMKNMPAEEVAAKLAVKVAQVYLVRHRVMPLLKKEVRILRTEPI